MHNAYSANDIVCQRIRRCVKFNRSRVSLLRPAPDSSDAAWRGETSRVSDDTRSGQQGRRVHVPGTSVSPTQQHDMNTHEGDVSCQSGPWQLNSFDPVTVSPPPGPARELHITRPTRTVVPGSSRAAQGGGDTARLWRSAGANQSWDTERRVFRTSDAFAPVGAPPVQSRRPPPLVCCVAR